MKQPRLVLAIILTSAGLAIWWTFGGHGGITPGIAAWLAVALVLAIVPATRRSIADALNHICNPSPWSRRWTMLAIFIASVTYLYAAAVMQHREFIPRFHDEFMHLVQM